MRFVRVQAIGIERKGTEMRKRWRRVTTVA